jgi:small subunit ribosomal protein S13
MPRLLGIDIPGDKKLLYSLCYIYGIGLTRAKIICTASALDPDRRAHTLTEEESNKLSAVITEKQFRVEGDLRREVSSNLKRLQSINSYRGLRHRRGLPVRGQRTQSNSRTRKGKRKTIGVIVKK